MHCRFPYYSLLLNVSMSVVSSLPQFPLLLSLLTSCMQPRQPVRFYSLPSHTLSFALTNIGPFTKNSRASEVQRTQNSFDRAKSSAGEQTTVPMSPSLYWNRFYNTNWFRNGNSITSLTKKLDTNPSQPTSAEDCLFLMYVFTTSIRMDPPVLTPFKK